MIFEKLSQKDKELIFSYIRTFGPNSGHNSYRSPDFDKLNYLLRFWNDNKSEYLYKWLGENFILEKEVSYKTPESKLREQIHHSKNYGKMAEFVREFSIWIDSHCSIWSNDSEHLLYLIDNRNLASNSYFYGSETTYTIEFSDGQKLRFDNGAKTMKLLGKAAKIMGLEKQFEEFRLEHSRLLNQKNLEGILCLSIHPLDYMTMSDNASNWHSCMNWQEPGGYRMGTVEMMNSPMVVMAYLKSKDRNYSWYDCYSCKSPSWNDKHWRTLIVATQEGIVSVKGYPYQCDELSIMCVDWLKELAEKNMGLNFAKTTTFPDCSVFEYEGEQFEVCPETGGSMYNDFGAATHFGSFSELATTNLEFISNIYGGNKFYRFNPDYSGETECMCCGQLGGYYEEESFVFCDQCCDQGDYTGYECAHCGSTWDEADMVWIDDEPYCPDCIEEVATRCRIDGCYYLKDDIITAYVAREKDNPTEQDISFEISNSFTGYWSLPSRRFNVEYIRQTEERIYYLNEEDITEAGYDTYFYMDLGSEEAREKYFKNLEEPK